MGPNLLIPIRQFSGNVIDPYWIVPMGTGGNGGEELMRRLTCDPSFQLLNNHLGDFKSEEGQVGKLRNKFFKTYDFIIC